MSSENKKTLLTKYGNARIDNGYYRISSSKEGNNGKLLHRLIYEEKSENSIPEGYVIHHIDGNPLNNDIENLICIQDAHHRKHHAKMDINYGFKGKIHSEKTKQKMSKNSKREKLSAETRNKLSKAKKGEKHPKYRHDIDNREIVDLRSKGWTLVKIAEKFGCNRATIIRRIKQFA